MIKKIVKLIKEISPYFGISLIYLLVFLLVVFLFNYYIPTAALHQKINPFLLLVRWDSIHYINIATGVNQPSVFFPLYPLLIKILSFFFSFITSGFLVSFISFSISLYYLDKLITRDFGEFISKRSIILLLFFPTAIFFPLIYTEALFLALLTAFFYYLGEKKWLVAVIIGFFASITRNIGIFLWPVYLLSLFFNFFPNSWKDVYKNICALLRKKEFWYSFIIPLGLFVYCLYCYFVLGDFLSFISGQKNWSDTHVFMWPWETLKNFFVIIINNPIDKIGIYNTFGILFIELGSFMLLSITTIYWIIKKHWFYAIFCLLNTILFSFIFPMTSVNRYVVVIFPIFIFLSLITKKRDWVFYTILALFFVLFFFNIYLISTGSWVG